MRQQTHTHPCRTCGVKVTCHGSYERNYDGWPEVICRAYHGNNWDNGWLCEDCERQEREADEHAQRRAELETL